MDVTVLGLYLNVCGLYCENLWYYRVCEDYNGAISKVLGDKWINPRILSVQSLEAHHRSGQFPHKTPNSLLHCTRNGTELLSDVIKYTLKASIASLTLNLLFISSKLKFIIQNVSLILFLCELITAHEPRSKLITLLPKYSFSALVCHNLQG